MDYKDYYKVLGVERSSSDKDIKEAYRRLARKYHPDVNPGDVKASDKFKEINEAYQVLSDKEKRSRYDNIGENWQYYGNQPSGNSWGAQQDASFRKDFDGTHVEFSDLGGGGFSDFFKTFFGHDNPFFSESRFEDSGSGGAHVNRGQDAEVSLDVTLEEAYKGNSKIIEVQLPQMCAVCGGRKHTKEKVCGNCRGEGVVENAKRLQIKIPLGAFDGMKIRLGGQGFENGNGRKGKSGDLFLLVKLLPHPIFLRKGDDIYSKIPVPVWDAVLGGEIKVDTLKGKMLLKLPAETQSGKAFRLEKCGMPRLDGAGYGDHYAEIKILIPEKLTEEEKQLFTKLKDLSACGTHR